MPCLFRHKNAIGLTNGKKEVKNELPSNADNADDWSLPYIKGLMDEAEIS